MEHGNQEDFNENIANISEDDGIKHVEDNIKFNKI